MTWVNRRQGATCEWIPAAVCAGAIGLAYQAEWLFGAGAAFCGIAADNMTLLTSVFLAGLLGGATHCGGMCGPFVMSQVARRMDPDGRDLTSWARLRGAALVPYHLGRMTTYAGLGAAAGGLADALAAGTRLRWAPAALLLVAATLFLIQAAQGLAPVIQVRWGTPRLSALSAALSRLAAPLFADPRGARGFALGFTLGFLPCGLLYSALVAAAGSGGALTGAMSLAAFGLGTVPGLLAIGWGTALAGNRLRGLVRLAAGPLAAVNGVLLAALAVRALA